MRTNVRGARLTVDETERPDGLAAGSFDLAPGKHTVTLNWGRQKLSKPIELAGATSELALNFTNVQIIDTCRRSVCLVRTRYGHGAGFLVEDQQTIITAAHVIDDARTVDEIECVFSPTSPPGSPGADEARFNVSALVHYSPKHDVAVLRLKAPAPADRQPLPLAVERPLPHTKVVAVGNPGLDDERFSPLEVTPEGVVTNNQPKLQTDLKIRAGFSGGPVFTTGSDNQTGGAVVGVVSATLELNERQEQAILVPTEAFADLVRQWLQADDERRDEIARVATDRFQRLALPRRAADLSLRLALASMINTVICLEAAIDAANALEQGGHAGLMRWNREVHPKLVREVREKFSPVHEEWVKALYDEVIADDQVSEKTRKELRRAYGYYLKIKKDADEITDPTIANFVRRVTGNWEILLPNLERLIQESVRQLEAEAAR